jgi:hypothetical protein
VLTDIKTPQYTKKGLFSAVLDIFVPTERPKDRGLREFDRRSAALGMHLKKIAVEE